MAHVASAHGRPVVIGQDGGGTPIGGIQDLSRPRRLGPGVRWLRSAQAQTCLEADGSPGASASWKKSCQQATQEAVQLEKDLALAKTQLAGWL